VADTFTLNERNTEVLKTLTGIRLTRRIDTRSPGTSAVSSRTVAIDALPKKSGKIAKTTEDWIYIIGRTETGFEKEFRCLLFSSENVTKVEDFLKSVFPDWE
jgi:hypothetical protein